MAVIRRRRSRKPILPRVADWVDRAGQVALARAWSFAIAAVRVACAAAAGIASWAWEWFRRQRGAVQLATVAGVGLACLLAGRWLRDNGPRFPFDMPVFETREEEALARVIRSEVGVGTPQQQLHVAWATRNLARARRQSIARMACSPCGRQGAGRPVSTNQRASDSDRELARHVLSASWSFDPTGGATHFVNPRLQDELARNGRVPGYYGQTYAKVRERWTRRYGWEPYYRLGPDLEMWGTKRGRRRR